MKRHGALGLVPVLAAALLSVAVGRGHCQSHNLLGTVEVEGNKQLRNLIVYLAPQQVAQRGSSSRDHRVSQKGRHFKPGLLVITRGDKVQWLNDEDREIDHNVYSLSKVKSFDLGLHERGSTIEVTFNQVGRLNYFCSVHKRMEGRVVVLPTRHFAVLDKPGSFIIPDVPQGKWVLKTVVLHRRYKSEALTLSVGEKSAKDVVIHIVKR